MTRDTSVKNATEIYNSLSAADQAKINVIIELAVSLLRGVEQASSK